MDRVVAARAGRRAALASALVCAAFSLGTAQAQALPSLGGLLHAPVSGLHVDLGCANPANHGLVGRVLSAARTTAGGPLRCFSTAIAADQGARPEDHGRADRPRAEPDPVGLQAERPAIRWAHGRDRRRLRRSEGCSRTSRRSARPTACRRARRPTAASRRSTRAARRARCPSADYGWAEEISLDLDAVSSACPDCHILLVEASSRTARISARRSIPRRRRPEWRRFRTATAGVSTSSHPERRRALQPSGGRDHGELRRLRVRRQLAGVVAVRDRRRRNDAQHRGQRARLDARPPGPAPAAAARRMSPSPRGSTTPAAPSGPSPTSRPTRTRTAVSACTTRTTAAGRAASATC